MTRLSTATRRFTATSNSDTQGSAESRKRRCTRRCASVFFMPFCASARFPASPLPGFPAFRLPASQLFCFLASFPLFSFPSSFLLPPSPPSPPSLLLLCLRPLPEPPVFCPLWMEWRGRGPCPDAVWPLPAVFWGVASRIPRVPPAFGWRVREGKLRRALDVGCGAGPLVGRSGPLVRAAAWCLLAGGAQTRRRDRRT